MSIKNDPLEGISRLGLGAWAIGGPYQYGWGAVDDAESITTIRAAASEGLNWIDTAPAYGYGHSESIVGEALDGLSNPPMIFTKCGRTWDSDGRVTSDLRPKSIRKQLEQSVQRLRVEEVDLYQIHRPDMVTGTPIEESWSELADLKKEGRVRAIGLSNVNLDQYSRCAAIEPVDSLQVPVNLLRTGDTALRERAVNDGAKVLAYSPMESGLLTDQFDNERMDRLPEDDWRKNSPKFSPQALAGASPILALLRRISASSGYSAAALAVAWVLRQPGVTAAIVGARRPSQVASWIDARRLELDPSEWLELDEAARGRHD